MKRFLSLLLILCCVAAVQAQGTCDNAYVVSSEFNTNLPSGGTYWFSAWTYDLPLTVKFAPVNSTTTKTPVALLDFTCRADHVYDQDSILNKFFNGDDSGDVSLTTEMPKPLDFDSVIENGQKIYSISIGRNYRDAFSILGIYHDIQAFVKVTFGEGGSVSFLPDTLFRNCDEHSHRVSLGEELPIAPNDTDKVYIFPYSEWKNDSIRFVWNGKQNLRIWMGYNDCNYYLSQKDPNFWEVYDVASLDTLRLSMDEINKTIDNVKSGLNGKDFDGLFYVRMQTTGAGLLKVENIPPFDEGTFPLEYDKAEVLSPNDTNKVFYIKSEDWLESTTFTSTAAHSMQMAVSTTSHASFSTSDPKVLGVFGFDVEESGRTLCLTKKEMTTLLSKTANKYVYVRFRCAAGTTLTPSLWSTTNCEDRSTRIFMDVPFDVIRKSSSTIYRIHYDDFGGDTLSVSWTSTSTLPLYIGDTCDFPLNPNNAFVNGRVLTVPAGGSDYFAGNTTATWESKAASRDGYLYVRLNPDANGTATFRTSKVVLDPEPDDPDPTDPDPTDPEQEPVPDGVLVPLSQEDIVARGATAYCDCSDLDLKFYVTVEQDLKLYDGNGHLVDEWHQSPSDLPHTYTPICGVEYVLKGKTGTVRIVR